MSQDLPQPAEGALSPQTTTTRTGRVVQVSADLARQLADLGRTSFYFFTKAILGFSLLNPRIHKPLCELFQAIDNRRLRVVLPRSWYKTTICSIAYPLWRAVKDPNIRVLLVQNTFTNAVAKLRLIKQIVEDNPLFNAIYPEIQKGDIWKAESLCLKRSKALVESTFEAAGTGTQVVSRHYDIIIEDDTVAPDLDQLTETSLLPSQADVDHAIGFHRLTTPLLNDPRESQIIVIGTRWYELDLLSWISLNEPNYRSYERSCRETGGVSDETGELTYPEKFDDEVLAEIKRALGPYMFSCLYLNKPIRSEDMVFHPEWCQYYDTPPRDLITYTTVDLAGDPEDSRGDPDWNVVLTCGKDLISGRIFVLDVWRRKTTPGDVIDAIFAHVRLYHPVQVGIEAVAYQKSILYWLRERQSKERLFFSIEPITHGRKSKNLRIVGLQPVFASGLVHLRTHHQELITELLAFPLGAHDDIIDCLAMQLEMWAMTQSVSERRRRQAVFDPLSLDGALESIRLRKALPVGSALDVFKTEPLLTF